MQAAGWQRLSLGAGPGVDCVMDAPRLPLFALLAASPLGLLALAAASGGVWVWLALAYGAGAVLALDLALPLVAEPGEDFAGSDLLLAVLALGGILALPVLVWAMAGGSGLSLAQRLGLFLASGLWLGQVAHPAAHELIHRRGRGLYLLGAAVYALLLFGHHASAHRLVHHRHVASRLDPNSARAGEGFYRFLRRAWMGSLREGLRAEKALRRGGRHPWGPYPLYALGAGLGLALGALVAGWAGLAVWAALGFHFGAQVLLSDYVQHYGLTRAERDGRAEPVGPAHAWNARHFFTGAMMLNATRHSDHHAHPARPYPALRLEPQMPQLPWPLPLACAVALVPPYWHRRMRPLLARLAKP